MGRPTKKDEIVQEEFISEMANEIMKWQKNGLHSNLQRVRGDLKKLFMHGARDDGYKMARDLDHMGWDCDSELVEILDCAWVSEDRALSKAIKKWVIEEGIKPAHSIGDFVKYEHKKNEELQFEITSINVDQATYRLTSEALGHIREGDKRQGTLGFIVPFEKIDTVDERVATTPLFEKE